MSGEDWKEFTVPKFKAFMAIWLCMDMTRQLNIKSLWHKRGSIFHCLIIFRITTNSQFEDLTRCLHITEPDNIST